MIRIIGFLVTALVLAPLLAGCSGGDESHARGGGGRGSKGKEVAAPIAVQTIVVGEIASYYTATATLAAEKEAEVLARIGGVVKNLVAEEGDTVAEGELLLRIDNDEYRYRLDQAQASLADFERKLGRVEEMRAQDLVSPEEFETTKNNLESARAEEGLARLNLSYTSVAAPFSGRVVARYVSVGQTVSAGTPLFLLSDFNPLLARVHVPSREFNKLRQDLTVDLMVESSGQRLSGRIKLISPVIDPASGTIKVTIEISEYPEGTRPGDFAQVNIVTERREGVTLVPRTSVVTDRGEQVVFIAAADTTAERRVVEVGFEDDTNSQIISGVVTGEQVVTKGQRSLKHGQSIKLLEIDGVIQADSTGGAQSARRRKGR